MDGATNACRNCGCPVVRLPNCRWCGMVISTIGETMDWLAGEGEVRTMTTTRVRPRSLPSTTTKLQTEMGSLFVTVSTDEDGEPFEVFGFLGKGR